MNQYNIWKAMRNAWVGTLVLVTLVNAVGRERPNVLFIAIDDLNDWVSVFGGHPKAITPHMDRLAQDGAMVFQNAHCAGPVCCPSRSSTTR